MAAGIQDDHDSAPVARASGIVALSDRQGDTRQVIPASRRPDGTMRKERAVRPGYTPPEDLQRYRPPARRDGNRSAPGSPAATHVLRNLVASNERRNASPQKGGGAVVPCARSPPASSSTHDQSNVKTPLPPSSPGQQRPGRTQRAQGSPGGARATLATSALRAALQSNHKTATGSSHRQQTTSAPPPPTDVFRARSQQPSDTPSPSPFSRRLADSSPSTASTRADAQSTWRSSGPTLAKHSSGSPRRPHYRSSPPIDQDAPALYSPQGLKKNSKSHPKQPLASPATSHSKHTPRRRSSPSPLPQNDGDDSDKLSQLVSNMHL
ncbi:hypothetical protein H4R34_002009 [Dimargaris verticillata]|uniref:WIBG Mago-binding domain-containing protein n=1 Tax=Dimargaris verticillata TaxID=2761393 RepID=A0A9W8EDY4_9FUNG|nr:hypothetical protein H4R34_002009 [Dimargaris verticillata]